MISFCNEALFADITTNILFQARSDRGAGTQVGREHCSFSAFRPRRYLLSGDAKIPDSSTFSFSFSAPAAAADFAEFIYIQRLTPPSSGIVDYRGIADSIMICLIVGIAAMPMMPRRRLAMKMKGH